MRRNALWIAAVCVLLVGPLCACTASPDRLPSPPPTVLPTPAPSPTSLSLELLDPTDCEVHLWHALTGPQEAVLLELASAFEKTNAYGLKVRVEHHSPLDREILAASASGTPPDVLIASCDLILELQVINVAVSLQEYVNSARYGLSEADSADLWPLVLEGGCLAADSGRPLGLLLDSHIVVMFYNRAWLKKLKVDAPPGTWEQFREVCHAARDKKADTWGLVSVADGSAVVSWIQGLGGQLVDMDTGEVNLGSSEGIAALSVLHDLVQDGCAYCAEEPAVSHAAFASGHALFTFGSTADLSAYSTSAAKGFDPGLAPVPYLTERPIVNVQGSVASILRTTPRQQLAAWLFLQWLMRPESDVRWALATGALPMRKSTVNAEAIQAYLEQNPMYKEACVLLAGAQTEPVARNWGAILTLLARAASSVCEVQVDPAEALAIADMAVDNLPNR